VANDAGDRVTPAVVAYRDTEQVIYQYFGNQIIITLQLSSAPNTDRLLKHVRLN